MCHEHETEGRVPCPFDPSHSVLAVQLEAHKFRCNSRPRPPPPCFQDHINAPRVLTGGDQMFMRKSMIFIARIIPEEPVPRPSPASVPVEQLHDVIARVRKHVAALLPHGLEMHEHSSAAVEQHIRDSALGECRLSKFKHQKQQVTLNMVEAKD